MNRLSLIFILFVCQINIFGQINKNGIPFLKNYLPKEYKAGEQNWGITQDNRGIMYFANNEAVLEYDGLNWNKYTMRNNSIVRSLAVDSFGIVYVGAVGEFGYLAPDESGNMNYVFLSATIDTQYANFKDVWKIFITKDAVLFYTFFKPTIIFEYKYKLPVNVYELKADKMGGFFSYYINDTFYLSHYFDGLKKFSYKDETKVVLGGEFYKNKDIFFMQSLDNDRYIVGANDGFYTYNRISGVSELYLEKGFKAINNEVIPNVIFCGTVWNNDYIVGTQNKGCYFFNKDGQIVYNLFQTNGLSSNTVYYTYSNDRFNYKPVWLATENGISKIDFMYPVNLYRNTDIFKGMVLDVVFFNNVVYIATTVGLYYIEKHEKYYEIKYVKNSTNAQHWSFCILNSERAGIQSHQKLYVGSHKGIYEISNDVAKVVNINKLKNEWFASYKLSNSRLDKNLIYLGYLNGLVILEYVAKNDFFNFKKIEEIKSEIRDIIEDDFGNIWCSDALQGVYKVDKYYKVTKYSKELKDKLVKIVKFKDKILYFTGDGVYNFNYDNNEFVLNSKLPAKKCKEYQKVAAIENEIWVSYFSQSSKLERWIYDSATSTFEVDSLIYKRINTTTFTSIIKDDKDNYWIGTASGLFCYNSKMKYNLFNKYYTLIRQVVLGNDSVIFHGNNIAKKPDYITDTLIKYVPALNQNELSKPILAYKNNSLRIHYAAPFFEDEQAITFSHILEGYEETWSNWSSESKAIYTNLYEGKYKFRVKARNIYGIESEEAIYEFTILPPWYRTWWAYGIYVILLGLFVWGIVLVATYRMKQINIAYGRYLPGAFLKLLEKRRVIDFNLGDMVEKEMTIMFSDIRSYTNLSESMHPTDNFKFLVRYLSHVGDMLHKNSGFPVQYYGDGVMAMFHGDTDNAVQAAVDMHGKVKEYSEERVKKGRRALQIGVGLHTGKIVMGIRGDARRWEGGIVGDAVNLAARMEGLTKMYGASTLISDDTFNRLKNPKKFNIRFIGKVKVKGKDVPVGMYEVLNGLPEDNFKLKIATKEMFDDALNNFFNGKLERAKDLFETVVKQNPADIAASHYICLCTKYISEGIPEDWDGVEKLDKK